MRLPAPDFTPLVSPNPDRHPALFLPLQAAVLAQEGETEEEQHDMQSTRGAFRGSVTCAYLKPIFPCSFCEPGEPGR